MGIRDKKNYMQGALVFRTRIIVRFVLSHELSGIIHELCHELNLWVIYGELLPYSQWVQVQISR